jgi:UDP-glucose 4-epimerase
MLLSASNRLSSVLVTGAAGFLGRAVVASLISRGHRALAFDSAAAPASLLSQLTVGGSTFTRGDIRDRALVASLAAESGEGTPILHLAGILTAGCDREPAAALAVNLGGTDAVLSAALAHGNRRVVFASTIGVYGRGLPQPITEDMRLEPDGWYGYTK